MDVGDVPPDFVNASEGGDCSSCEEGEHRPHGGEYGGGRYSRLKGREAGEGGGRTRWVVEAGRVAARRTKYATGGIGSRRGAE